MSVACLTPEEKNFIATHHNNKSMTQKEMANQFGVSERTINRTLNELGLATAVPRIKGEAYQAMQLLKKHGFSVKDLEILLSANTTQSVPEFVQEYLSTLSQKEVLALLPKDNAFPVTYDPQFALLA